MKPFHDPQVFAFTDALLDDPNDLCSWCSLSDYLEERGDTRLVRYRNAVDVVRSHSVQDVIRFGLHPVNRGRVDPLLATTMAIALMRVPANIDVRGRCQFEEIWGRWPLHVRRVVTAAELGMLGLLTKDQLNDDRVKVPNQYRKATWAGSSREHRLCKTLLQQVDSCLHGDGDRSPILKEFMLDYLFIEWLEVECRDPLIMKRLLDDVPVYLVKLPLSCLVHLSIYFLDYQEDS